MKKTLITLLALAGVASAETVDLLASSDGWEFSQSSLSGGVLIGTGHWKSGYAYYTLGTPITLSTSDTLELSYTLTFNTTSDVAATVALHSSSDVLAFGAKTYVGSSNDAPLCIGYSTATEAIEANAITFAANNGYGYIFTSYTDTGVTAGITRSSENETASHSIREVISWSGDKYVASIYVDGNAVGTQDLGTSYTLEKITFASAGNTTSYDSRPSVSNMQLALIPEPTTATLSLLALAGLAARRRRK